MSNKLYLVSTKFKNSDGNSSYGYRIYDDYGLDYYNLLGGWMLDAEHLLTLAKEMSPNFFEDNKDWIEINGESHEI